MTDVCVPLKQKQPVSPKKHRQKLINVYGYYRPPSLYGMFLRLGVSCLLELLRKPAENKFLIGTTVLAAKKLFTHLLSNILKKEAMKVVDVKKNSVPRRSFNDIFYDLAEHMWKNLSVAEFEVKVQRAIDQGFPIDFVSSSKFYPGRLLERAINTSANYEYADVLLDAGADVNLKDKGGKNALDLAICNNLPAEIVRRIITLTRDVNAEDNSQLTALYSLAIGYIYFGKYDVQSKDDVLNALLSAGADPQIECLQTLLYNKITKPQYQYVKQVQVYENRRRIFTNILELYQEIKSQLTPNLCEEYEYAL